MCVNFEIGSSLEQTTNHKNNKSFKVVHSENEIQEVIKVFKCDKAKAVSMLDSSIRLHEDKYGMEHDTPPLYINQYGDKCW